MSGKLINIGSQVKVNLLNSKDRLSQKTIEKIIYNPINTVIDYKITDGKGIGVILELHDGSKEWFFETEINLVNQDGDIIPNLSNELTVENRVLNYSPKQKLVFKNDLKPEIKSIINPINYFKWLIYSLKDVI